jgi:hypothetical protein
VFAGMVFLFEKLARKSASRHRQSSLASIARCLGLALSGRNDNTNIISGRGDPRELLGLGHFGGELVGGQESIGSTLSIGADLFGLPGGEADLAEGGAEQGFRAPPGPHHAIAGVAAVGQ